MRRHYIAILSETRQTAGQSTLEARTMTRITTILVAVSLTAAAGCVPSLQPFYAGKDITFDAGLIGTWKQVNEQWTWTFSRSKSEGKNKYDIVIVTKEGKKEKQSKMVGTLVRIKDTTYLDMFPGEPAEGSQEKISAFWAYHVLPLHTLWKFERSDGTVKLHAMNPEWIKKYLKDNPRAIAHMTTKDDRLILTASTEKLQAFVNKHKSTKNAFREASVLKKQ